MNNIKLHIKLKKKKLLLKKNNKNNSIFEILLKTNIVLGIKNFEKHTIVFLNTNYPYYTMKNLYKKNSPRIVKYKYLNKFQNKYTLSMYLYSTSKGLLLTEDLKKNKIGGLLIYRCN